MTRIEFFILPDAAGEARDHYACSLAEQCFRRGQRVLLHAGDDAHRQRLDRLLWSFRDSSFVPHGLLGDQHPPAPVEIGCGDDAEGQYQVLINLSDELPPFFSRFELFYEILCEEKHSKNLGRERFKRYRSEGYPLAHHNIRQRVPGIG